MRVEAERRRRGEEQEGIKHKDSSRESVKTDSKKDRDEDDGKGTQQTNRVQEKERGVDNIIRDLG